MAGYIKKGSKKYYAQQVGRMLYSGFTPEEIIEKLEITSDQFREYFRMYKTDLMKLKMEQNYLNRETTVIGSDLKQFLRGWYKSLYDLGYIDKKEYNYYTKLLKDEYFKKELLFRKGIIVV